MRGERLVVIVVAVAVFAGLALLWVLRQQTLAQRAHRQQLERQQLQDR